MNRNPATDSPAPYVQHGNRRRRLSSPALGEDGARTGAGRPMIQGATSPASPRECATPGCTVKPKPPFKRCHECNNKCKTCEIEIRRHPDRIQCAGCNEIGLQEVETHTPNLGGCVNIMILQLPMTVGTALEKLQDKPKALVTDELGVQQGLVLRRDIIQLVRDRNGAPDRPAAIEQSPNSVVAQGGGDRRQLQSPGNGHEPGNLRTDGRYEAPDPTVSQQQRNLANVLGGDELAIMQAQAMVAARELHPHYMSEMPGSPQDHGGGVAHHTFPQPRSPIRQEQESRAADIVLVLDHRGHAYVLGKKTFNLSSFLNQRSQSGVKNFQFGKQDNCPLWTWRPTEPLRDRATRLEALNNLKSTLHARAEKEGLTFIAVATTDSRASPPIRAAGPAAPVRETARQ